MTRTLFLLVATCLFAQEARWTAAQANGWYQKQPWLVGGNYTPGHGD